METEFLNDARKEIEGRAEEFYKELKAFYQGSGEAEQKLMEQTTQPFWQSLRLNRKRLQQRNLTVDMEMQEPARPADYDGPKKDGYDYTCHRTKAVKMRRTYYRKGKKITTLKTPEIVEANFLKADVQGDMAICPNCGHEGKLSSYTDGCDACGDSEAVKEAYHEALLESGFIELQQYPEGFAVYKIEDPSEYTVDEEEEMFYLVICAENAPEGITVTATLVDENWDPVQE